jgi:hypothetical protein
MEIQAKDLYFLERALKEPARQLTQAVRSERSPILHKFACPQRQAQAPAVNPHDQSRSGARSCFSTFTNHPENVESIRVEPNRSHRFG